MESIRSRLGLRVALSILTCIVVVEAAVLVPSYLNYEHDLRVRLAQTGRATVVAVLRSHPDADEQQLLTDGRVLMRDTPVRGAAFYRRDGSQVGTFGEVPELSPTNLAALNDTGRLSIDRQRLDVVWHAEETRLPVTVVGRLDSSWMAEELRGFASRATGMALIIAGIVFSVTMLVFSNVVLRPIVGMRDSLLAAGQEPTNPEAHVMPEVRTDELGEVMVALNNMVRRTAADIGELQDARRALTEAKDRLESHVQERTQELVATNSSLQREVAERERMEEQLRHDALHDKLTKLPKRQLFVDRVAHAILRTRRDKGRNFAVMLLNLDRFKAVNDSLGYLAGDELLVIVTERFIKALRPGDTIARTGGDEFAILLEDVTSTDQATAAADRIQARLAEPIMIEAQEVYTRFSMGITFSTLGYIQAESMMQDAEVALQHAKSAGKDRVKMFRESMRSSSTRMLKTESDLRRALASGDQLQLFYQPIVSLENSRIVGFEGLIRWNHPDRGFLTPNEFIPLAEETGLIVSMGRWVIEEAIRQIVIWSKDYPDVAPDYVSVNVSGRQVTDGHLVEDVKGMLDSAGLPANRLKLEVTESLLIDSPELARVVLEELKSMDVRISIDDFGTGYSSLAYLRRFPFDVLKIDRLFVSTMTEEHESLEIVRMVIDMAKVLGMEVVAEGVQTLEEVEHLRDMKCQYVQGYFFAPPLNCKDAAKALIAQPAPASEDPLQLQMLEQRVREMGTNS